MDKKKLSIALIAATLVMPLFNLLAIGRLLMIFFVIPVVIVFFLMGVTEVFKWETDEEIKLDNASVDNNSRIRSIVTTVLCKVVDILFPPIVGLISIIIILAILPTQDGATDRTLGTIVTICVALGYSIVLKKKATNESRVHSILTAILRKSVEVPLFFGLGFMYVTVMFTIIPIHSLGTDRSVGATITFYAALGCCILLNRKICNYYSQLVHVSLAALVLAAVCYTDFYWDYLYKRENAEYHHLARIYSSSLRYDEERELEEAKAQCLDSESYNHFDSLLTKANAMAAEMDSARVLYLLMNYNKKGGGKLQEMVFDHEAYNKWFGGKVLDLEHFDQNIREIHDNTKLIVVTDDPEAATARLKSLSNENKVIIIVK